MDFQKALKTVTYPEFFWADRYVHQTHEGSTMALSLDFFVKTFANYLSLPYKKLFFVDMIFKKFIYSNKNLFCMAINLWELGSDLSWNSAASCTEGMTQRSVIYLHQRNQKVQNHYHKIKKSNICVIYYVSKRMKILS